MVKTRFAPSPTGELHIGSARTALFAYLFARSKGGEFFLRIEDTDRARFVEGSTERIIDSLKWLGMKPDNLNNIVYQSKRLDIYKEAALRLLKEGKAYICTCSKERLEKLREEQTKKKLPPMYDKHCRDKSEIRNPKSETNSNIKISEIQNIETLDSILAAGAVIRMKMPTSGKIVVNDLIRGEVEFDLSLIDDQVILKSDGFPTYHLAHVVDDHEMEITHVIRGEEWLPSTPKHLVLWEMFGWKVPEYAHLPLIHGSDKKKLSKRHGAMSVMQYKEAGYLPEALVNFIAFLGWNPKDEREMFSLEELEKEFKIENINKAPAVFDVDKLNNINEYYLKVISYQLSVIDKLLKDFGIDNLSSGEAKLLGRGGFKTLKEMAEEILNLRKPSDYDGKLLIFKKSTKENTLKGLQLTTDNLQLITEKDWNSQELQMQMGLIVERNNLTNGDVFWPVRVALSGQEKSPSPVELAIALGREESLKRLNKAIKKLS